MNRLYLQLGRAGDILNILPLCHRDFVATGERPVLMVAEPFASLLEGVSYVEPFIWTGEFENVAGALIRAETLAHDRKLQLVCTQIYGAGLVCAEKCSSFMRESWERLPDAPAWGTLPLVFDRRDPPREQAVKQQLLARAGGKPYVLLALAGTSSPFAPAHDLTRQLRHDLGAEFDFVDISAFIAPRFFDLLELLSGAHALVTVDSGLLHLAHAVPSLPVIAFVTREPSGWHGSPWRASHVARFFYDEAPACFPRVTRAIRGAREPAAAPRIWHVWSDYRPDQLDTARRMDFARATWKNEYSSGGQWRACAFTVDDEYRDSSNVGDRRPMPYLADLADHVCAHAPRPHDIIAVTNADVCFTPGLTGWLLDAVPRHGAAFTHRWDFARLESPKVNEAEVKRGEWYPGSDAFFFTVEWWRRHGAEYPPMILGREQCDEVLRQLIKRHGGVEIAVAIYHEKHESLWNSPGHHAENRGNQHNRREARAWFVRHGYAANDWKWWALPAKPF